MLVTGTLYIKQQSKLAISPRTERASDTVMNTVCAAVIVNVPGLSFIIEVGRILLKSNPGILLLWCSQYAGHQTQISQGISAAHSP